MLYFVVILLDFVKRISKLLSKAQQEDKLLLVFW